MNRISELRNKLGISMKEAAARLDMPYTTYVNYEKGTREPNSETLIKLSRFFGTTIDYLLGNQRAQDSSSCRRTRKATIHRIIFACIVAFFCVFLSADYFLTTFIFGSQTRPC